MKYTFLLSSLVVLFSCKNKPPNGYYSDKSNSPVKIDTITKKLNKKVGVSLNPETKIDTIIEHLKKIDLVLIMSVNPGFGGQKFMPEVLEKVKKLSDIKEKQELNFDIEIDGGINFDNSKTAIEAGANILVSGTTIFKSNNGDIKKNIELLRSK